MNVVLLYYLGTMELDIILFNVHFFECYREKKKYPERLGSSVYLHKTFSATTLTNNLENKKMSFPFLVEMIQFRLLN